MGFLVQDLGVKKFKNIFQTVIFQRFPFYDMKDNFLSNVHNTAMLPGHFKVKVSL